jgi:hypothetical protein
MGVETPPYFYYGVVMNYASIQSKISNILKRGTSLDADIPDWIAFTESQIESELRDCSSMQSTIVTLTSGANFIAMPTLLEVIDVYITIGDQPVSLSAIAVLPPNNTDPSIPQFWTSDINGIRFDTIADQDYDVTIQLYGQLDIAVSENWVSDNVPDAYIYGALVHSTVKTQADPSMYSSMFDVAISKAKRLNAKRKGQSSMTVRTDVPPSVQYSGYNIYTG